MNGSRDETELCKKIETNMEFPATLTCHLSINGLTGLVSKMNLVISNDTGTLHLARALKTPTIGIQWCGNRIHFGPSSIQDNATFVSWQTQCPVCKQELSKAKCIHEASIVSEISPEDIISCALSILALKNAN